MPRPECALALASIASLAAPAQAERYAPGRNLQVEAGGCAATLLFIEADPYRLRFEFRNPGTAPVRVRVSARYLYRAGLSNIDRTYSVSNSVRPGQWAVDMPLDGSPRFHGGGSWTVTYTC
jgi:hypothetical protein